MSVTVINNTGSGRLATQSVASYAYSEDVTSLQPADPSGGTGQVSVTAPAETLDKDGNTHPNSLLLINNLMTLSDNDKGSIQFRVKTASVSSGMVTVSGQTVESRLNVQKTALPHGGSGRNLFTAVNYYCSLVGITPTISSELQTEMEAVSVNFIGWVGNVWEHLKMLCAGVSLSSTGNVGLEMIFKDGNLSFRKAGQSLATYGEYLDSQSVSVDSYDAAQSVKIFNYNTEYGVNRVVKDLSNAGELMGYNTENVSIADSMQVDAGETVTKRFTINASLEAVNQPVCVSTISPFPYTGLTGQYVIVGTDNLPIDPQQWRDLGGLVSVSLTENPNEIEISVTAPPIVSIPLAEGDGSGLAPYKIGVESSGEQDYPAFYITGTGVFYNKQEHSFLTGASSDFTSKTDATSIDNPFITKPHDLSVKGVAAAQALCGPKVSLAESTPLDVAFGSTPGSVRNVGSNKFRVTNVSYTPGSTSITAEAFAKFSDFDSIWASTTFAGFESVALNPSTYPDDALKFNEFTVIPLMENN